MAVKIPHWINFFSQAWSAWRHYKYTSLKPSRYTDLLKYHFLTDEQDLKLKKLRVCTTYIYIYIHTPDSLKNKTKNSAGLLCALQRKEMWLCFPFASLKVQCKPHVFASRTRQSQLLPLQSLFHWRDAQSQPQLSHRRQRVLGEREAGVTPRTGSPCHFFWSGRSPTGELSCSLPC